ncbi:FAD-dependent monooxygenase [Acidiphilium sp.]|uniref:FAD-dependent monooxygenase n=1 Tax=Acidiphilium sp. TaxID=527 RepID=UPI003CFE849E
MAPVIIAGGGIGGLVLALMLHRRGIACQVREAAPAVRPLGVGINILPHAVAELAELDLLDALDTISIRTRTLTYMTQRGQTIWHEPRGCYAGHAVPQISAHRGRLQSLLWQTAQARLGLGAVRADARVIGATQDAASVTVTVRTADGETSEMTGHALIGADGIHSMLRAALLGDDSPMRWNGIQMWRGAVDWPAFGSRDEMIIAGDATAKLVFYPIAPGSTSDRRLTNWVVYARIADASTMPPGRESWSARGAFAEFARLIEGFALPMVDIPALASATAEIFRYPMCDRDPLPVWTQGRITLLGDAAHSMYPVGSNGASQAILDARCLADCLTEGDVPAALAQYEAERQPVTTAIVHSNRVGGPERVIDLIAARAPAGFDRLETVATADELAAIVRGYASLAGFAAPSGAIAIQARS